MGADSVSILCVDDERLALALRKLVLEMQGYRVITADSMNSAMAVLACENIDLVLTDQLMPGGTGTELARMVKLRHPALPVVLISGVNEIPSDAWFTDLFISKVEGPKRLCEKIHAVLTERGHFVD